MQLTLLDWLVFCSYFLILAALAWWVNLRQANNSKEYFLAANTMPVWLVAISVLATSQSAATFLGGPDMGFRGNLTYLASNIGAILAAFFVMKWLIPRYYALKVTTVYELLEQRFNARAKNHAGKMYLFGRVFASGARLYMAALAVAMLVFNNIEATSIVMAVALLAIIGVLCTLVGGIRSVIYTDALQCAVYVSAALFVLVFLYQQLDLPLPTLINALRYPPELDGSKLLLFDTRHDFSSTGVFTLWSALTGFVLLNIAAFGLDQDMTQRVLTCKTPAQGARALLTSALIVIPVMLVFIVIGFLLYIFYQRPELYQSAMLLNNTAQATSTSITTPIQRAEFEERFQGEKITVFMQYVLHELPSGLRGLVVVGVIAAALSTITSGLNSMASVLVADLYQPWRLQRIPTTPDRHFVRAGQWAMLGTALALSLMAILCYYWQQYSDMPLLAFALSVMVFSYSGLLGVFFTALFTQRGNSRSVTAALITGFLITLFMQPYVINTVIQTILQPLLAMFIPTATGLANLNVDIGFTWQLCIGTVIAFLVCYSGKPTATAFTRGASRSQQHAIDHAH
ncbi:sodium:solute symporter [Alishewanella tabrizica]|uniref:Sodium:solute symporter n=1 Tax=Alishewanella tabrizica TaxID=671278 RepID=A0ABQ2WWC6_9ALTE|nr:sodium:solute symporter [Alishewanella tabrizica]GGW71952.1 sodium:solute symporter [Alishewanella tabrizica]